MNFKTCCLSLVFGLCGVCWAEPANYTLVDYYGVDGDPAGIWPTVWLRTVNHGDQTVSVKTHYVETWSGIAGQTPNGTESGASGWYNVSPGPNNATVGVYRSIGFSGRTDTDLNYSLVITAEFSGAGLHQAVDGQNPVELSWTIHPPHFLEGNICVQADIYFHTEDGIPRETRLDLSVVSFDWVNDGNVGNGGNSSGESGTGTNSVTSGASITNYVSQVQGGTNGVSVGNQTIDVNVKVDLGGYTGSFPAWNDPGTAPDTEGSLTGLGNAFDSASRTDIATQIPKLSGLSGLSFGSESQFTLPGGSILGDIDIDLSKLGAAIVIFRVIVLFGCVIMFTFAAQSIIRKGVA